jgi:hypothetical protein
VLGIGQGDAGYIADGAGGYTIGSGRSAVSGSGSTIANYVNMALLGIGAARRKSV